MLLVCFGLVLVRLVPLVCFGLVFGSFWSVLVLVLVWFLDTMVLFGLFWYGFGYFGSSWSFMVLWSLLVTLVPYGSWSGLVWFLFLLMVIHGSLVVPFGLVWFVMVLFGPFRFLVTFVLHGPFASSLFFCVCF